MYIYIHTSSLLVGLFVLCCIFSSLYTTFIKCKSKKKTQYKLIIVNKILYYKYVANSLGTYKWAEVVFRNNLEQF